MMTKRAAILALFGLLAVGALIVPQLAGAFPSPRPAAEPPPPAQTNPYSDAWLAANHGKFDNTWTAEYETRLQSKATQPASPLTSLLKTLIPLYGVDVRMSNGNLLGSNQNEFQIAINPANSQFAIGTSNDSGAAGVGVFRTTDGGVTWTSADASAYGVPASCCDPGVDYAGDGSAVYAIILSTSGGGITHIIKSTDNGATWPQRTQVLTPDRENIAVDPNNPNIVYLTYSDLPATNRIKGYKSTDGGLTWGPSFFVGAAAPAQGYEQSSQPRVASNGWLYVGYQQYTNSTTGCSAGVQNVLARSTDGGATFNYTVLPITQGGACSSAQAGRGIFCTNVAGTSSFRSRSHPIIGVNPTNPLHVYMMYSGGELETAYTCASSPGFHSDTLFRLSTDGGVTFSAPAKVNDDPSGKDQYFPWMDVTASGQIWVGWNDRRDDPNNVLSRWYQSYSNDEGATWRKLDGSLGNDPVADVQTQPSTFIGDYHGLAAKGNTVLGMWYDSRISASGDAYTDPQVPPAQGTPTPTVTGTPPTATQTRTATQTSTVTQTPTVTLTATATATINPCLVSTYVIATGTATIVPGTVNTGSACDDCDTAITLPFPFTLYGQVFTTVNASSNGRLDFATINEPGGYTNTCLPAVPNVGPYAYTIFAHWDDLRTDQAGNGIFTSVSGVAPNRIFNIEWRANYFSGTGTANFEVRLYEGQTRFDLVYGALGGGGTSATTGVQGPNNTFTQYSCNTGLTNGLLVTFTQPPCGTPTVGPSNTPTAPPTNTQTATAVASPTSAASSTATVTATGTPCPVQFNDVPVGSTFYDYVRCLACRGIVGGYPCGGPGEPCPGNYYRPNNNVTRGQVSKIVSESAGFSDVVPSTQQTFEDVAPGSTFHLWIERLSVRGIIGGYPCGGPFEPCVSPTNRPYFRPNNNVTRGQLSKITSGAAGWTETPTGQTFEDVAVGSTFYVYIERMASRGIISGYPCGGPFEPCVAPANRPYFRPNNNATRGQMSKIAASAFFPNCSTPAVRR